VKRDVRDPAGGSRSTYPKKVDAAKMGIRVEEAASPRESLDGKKRLRRKKENLPVIKGRRIDESANSRGVQHCLWREMNIRNRPAPKKRKMSGKKGERKSARRNDKKDGLDGGPGGERGTLRNSVHRELIKNAA